MEKPPFQFRLRTIFLLTFAAAVLCVAIPLFYRFVNSFTFREGLRQYWWVALLLGAIVARHLLRVLMAFMAFRNSDL